MALSQGDVLYQFHCDSVVLLDFSSGTVIPSTQFAFQRKSDNNELLAPAISVTYIVNSWFNLILSIVPCLPYLTARNFLPLRRSKSEAVGNTAKEVA